MNLMTDRLKIRNLRDKDLDDFLAYRSDPEVCKFQDYEPYTRTESETYIKCLKNDVFGDAGQWTQLGIELVGANKLIGDIGLKPETNDARIVEFGVSMSRKYQKHGYATEALTGIFDYLFTEKAVHRIVGIVDVENTSVIRLIERLKFRREAAFLESYWDKTMWRDEFLYAMLKKDWKTNRQ